MPTYRLLTVLAAALLGFPSYVNEQDNHRASTATVIARGKYIVEGVAVCWTCHTPRNQKGVPDEQRWSLGGAVPFEAARRTDGWADVAPRLAGLPPGTDEQFVTLLTTGISRSGGPPRPPMPQFRMTRSDAEAVLAYLKSIKSSE